MAFVSLFHLPETFDFVLFYFRKQQRPLKKNLSHHNY